MKFFNEKRNAGIIKLTLWAMTLVVMLPFLWLVKTAGPNYLGNLQAIFHAQDGLVLIWLKNSAGIHTYLFTDFSALQHYRRFCPCGSVHSISKNAFSFNFDNDVDSDYGDGNATLCVDRQSSPSRLHPGIDNLKFLLPLWSLLVLPVFQFGSSNRPCRHGKNGWTWRLGDILALGNSSLQISVVDRYLFLIHKSVEQLSIAESALG